MEVVREKITSFFRTRCVHQEKKIFFIFSENYTVHFWDTRNGTIYSERCFVSWYTDRCSQKKLHECRNKMFANSPFILTSRTFCDIIYNVKLSAVAETHEWRGVLWVLTISGFGNFLLIKT